MNKKELIEKTKKEQEERFGRFGHGEGNLLFAAPPANEKETIQHCNALFATGHYGICTDGCFNVGISGGCGPDCYVYKDGDCPVPDEIE